MKSCFLSAICPPQFVAFGLITGSRDFYSTQIDAAVVPVPEGRSECLSGPVYPAQESAQVPGQGHDKDACELKRKSVERRVFQPPPCPEMQPPDQPDQHARNSRKHKMQCQGALQCLSL